MDSNDNNPARLLTTRLLASHAPEVVQALAVAVAELGEGPTRAGTLAALRGLQDPAGIDALCAVWADTRHAALGQLIEAGGWVAHGPQGLTFLTRLKAGQVAPLRQAGAEGVNPLLRACDDPDEAVARQAWTVLLNLQNVEAQAELFRLIIETDHPRAARVVAEANYAPRDPQQRALIYLLTEQWAKYDDLDFDQSLIRAAYQIGNEWLQNRIATLTRQAGRADFVTVIAGGRQRRRLTEMTESEWDVVFTLLQQNQWWAEMWRLAQIAPPVWSVALLKRIQDTEWRPDNPEFTDLTRLAQQCLPAGLELGPDTACQQVLEQHQGAVNDIAISPAPLTSGQARGELLASAGDDRTVRLWTLPDGQPLKTLRGHTAEVLGLAVSPDGRMLASGSEDGTVRLWRLPDGKALTTLQAPSGMINRLSIGPWPGQSGAWLLAGAGRSSDIQLWGLPTGKPLQTLRGHADMVICLAFSRDGQHLASGSRDQTVRLWRLPGGKLVKTMGGHSNAVNSVAVQDNLLASGSLDKTVRLWNLSEGKSLKVLKNHQDAVLDVDLDPAGRLLASGGRDRSLSLWRLSDRKLLATLTGHTDWIIGLALSPDGQLLASAGYDGTIRLWRSDVARLCHTPLARATPADLDWVADKLQPRHCRPVERPWLEFVQAMLRWQRRFDIEVGEAPQLLSFGEFDIEISG